MELHEARELPLQDHSNINPVLMPNSNAYPLVTALPTSSYHEQSESKDQERKERTHPD
jgi:hypothetical protein